MGDDQCEWEFETFITILKIKIHTFDKCKQFYQKMCSNKLEARVSAIFKN